MEKNPEVKGKAFKANTDTLNLNVGVEKFKDLLLIVICLCLFIAIARPIVINIKALNVAWVTK